MTTLPTVLDAFTAAGFVAPDYGGQCLDGVLPAVAGALGAGLGVETSAEATSAAARLGVPTATRVCVVVVDGLGHRMLTERAGHAPFLRGRSGDGRVLTVGYPSTTAASMGLFGTGRGAGRTGLAGYTVRNPATGGLANLVSWEGAGPAHEWQRETTVFERLAGTGVEVTSVGPARFRGSGLTEAALRGARYVPAETLADRVDATLLELMAPGVVYLYWGEVDKAGHHHGWQSSEWADQLTVVDRELGRLARSMPRGTVLVVTADHGMVDVAPGGLIDVGRTPVLADGVELVAGEPRASHVHTRPGERDAVLARWRETLGTRAVVATREEAVAAGWFGEVAEHVGPLLGDLVVAATGRGGVADSRTQTPRSLELKGMHGSFTPEEMQVPLLVVT